MVLASQSIVVTSVKLNSNSTSGFTQLGAVKSGLHGSEGSGSALSPISQTPSPSASVMLGTHGSDGSGSAFIPRSQTPSPSASVMVGIHGSVGSGSGISPTSQTPSPSISTIGIHGSSISTQSVMKQLLASLKSIYTASPTSGLELGEVIDVTEFT